MRELAGRFHGFYHDCYVIGDVPPELTQARLWLVEAARIGLAIGLDLLGVSRARGDVTLSRAAAAAPAARHRGGRRRRPAARSAAATCSTWPRELGTPLFVYDEAHLRARCREAVAAFGDGVAYAAKAFLCLAMARLAHEEGMHLDVATGGELHVALAAGVPGRPARAARQQQVARRAAHGARTAGVGRIVVDCFDELDRLERAARRGRPACRRCSSGSRPGVEAHTHEFVRTGQVDSKFGFGVRGGRRRARRSTRAQDSPAVELVGLHMHIGSQVFVADFFHEAVEVVAPFVRELGLPELSIGGGLGVAYVEGEEAPVDHRVGRPPSCPACRDAGIDRAGDRRARPGDRRARPRVTLYTVGTIKDVPGIRTYVSVDGGMSDNPRPVLYGCGYEAFLPRAADADAARAGDGRRQALRVGRRAGARRPGARRPRRRRHPGHAGHRRLRPLDGLQLQQGAPPGGGVRRATARPAWSCAARPTTTSSATTSLA